MAHSQYAVRVFFSHLKPHPVIADALTQIAAAFELLDLAFAARSVLAERMQDRKRMLTIDCADLLLGSLGPDELAHRPNLRNTSSCDVPGPVSLRAASTSARS